MAKLPRGFVQDLLSRAWLFSLYPPALPLPIQKRSFAALLSPLQPCALIVPVTASQNKHNETQSFILLIFLFVCLYFQLQFLLRAEDSTVTQVFLNLLK